MKPLRYPLPVLSPQSPHPTLGYPLFLARGCGSLQVTPYGWFSFAELGSPSELCRHRPLKNFKKPTFYSFIKYTWVIWKIYMTQKKITITHNSHHLERTIVSMCPSRLCFVVLYKYACINSFLKTKRDYRYLLLYNPL